MTPRVPAFGKAVEQNDKASAAAALGIMKTNAADLRVAVPDRGIQTCQLIVHKNSATGTLA
jgi:hypothetical protein